MRQLFDSRVGWRLRHGSGPNPFCVLNIDIQSEFCVSNRVQRSVGAPHWWQRKVNPILRDTCPDFFCCLTCLIEVEEVHIAADGKIGDVPKQMS